MAKQKKNEDTGKNNDVSCFHGIGFEKSSARYDIILGKSRGVRRKGAKGNKRVEGGI
jgi:hypothetical protein